MPAYMIDIELPGICIPATKVCQDSLHSAFSLGWPFQVLKYGYIFQMKYTEAMLSNSMQTLNYQNAACSFS